MKEELKILWDWVYDFEYLVDSLENLIDKFISQAKQEEQNKIYDRYLQFLTTACDDPSLSEIKAIIFN